MAKKKSLKDKLINKPELLNDKKKMLSLLIEHLPEDKIDQIMDYYACIDLNIIEEMLDIDQYNQVIIDNFSIKYRSGEGLEDKDAESIITGWFDMLDISEIHGKSGLSFRYLSKDIDDLDVNDETRKFLDYAGVVKLEDLMKLSIEELIAFQDIAECDSISVAKDLIGLIRKMKGKKELIDSQKDVEKIVDNKISDTEEAKDIETEDKKNSRIMFLQSFPLSLRSPKGENVIRIDKFDLVGFYDDNGSVGVHFIIKGIVTNTFPSWFYAICYDADGCVIQKQYIEMSQAVPGVPYRFKNYIKVDKDTKRIEFEAFNG